MSHYPVPDLGMIFHELYGAGPYVLEAEVMVEENKTFVVGWADRKQLANGLQL